MASSLLQNAVQNLYTRFRTLAIRSQNQRGEDRDEEPIVQAINNGSSRPFATDPTLSNLFSKPEGDGDSVAEYDEDEDDEEEEEQGKIFEPVLNAIDFDAMCSVALNVRSRLERKDNGDVERARTCSVDKTPLTGSYNVVFILTFSDDLKWVVRIPGNGTVFTDLDVQRLNSVYGTMTYLRTKVPTLKLPEVFAWKTTTEDIGVPYAFMQFVEGTPLDERWADESWVTEDKRLKILTQLVCMTAGLHELQFDKIGALAFDGDGRYNSVSHIEGVVDASIDGMANFFTESTSGGPFDTTEAYLRDDWDDLSGCADWRRADLAILEMALETVPAEMAGDGHFTLSPPDYNYQNVFVDDDANVTGIIDWDGIQTAPRGLGCARYPSWITRDWDPGMYGYGISGARNEDSPQELSRYRQHYAAEFAKLSLPAYNPNETKLSHILEAVQIGLNDRMCRQYIAIKLLGHAFRPKAPFTFVEFADEVEANGEKVGSMKQQIRAAFQKMWFAEWETALPEGTE